MAQYTYQSLFMNTVNEIINKLTANLQPDADPGMTAWTWFQATGGSQPSQANEYIRSQLTVGMNTIFSPWFGIVNNGLSWSSALNTVLAGAPADVRKWLDSIWVATTMDPPPVPEDVITWTKANLPTSVAVVVRQGQKVNV
jgi:hypothetical protein